ncbi:MAG: photosynthetic complex assembly protein PuhC [Erythrobacter sp.]|nr:photosynthetic complex assembly protein PuhC [Erythrobacter sp.]
MIVAAIVRTYEEDEIRVHKIPLVMMGSLVVVSLALTASVTLGFFDREAVPSEVRAAAGTTVVATRSVQFVDEPDGTVRVEDGTSGDRIASFGPGTGGFVRSTARSLVHKRRIRGIGAETPFELIEWDDGALTLRDTTTGGTVELASFGKDNRKVFADMLGKGIRR